MKKKRSKQDALVVENEFTKLFWDARKEQSRLGRNTTGNESGFRSAVKFARAQGWAWAEFLLNASKLTWTGEHEKALSLLNQGGPFIPIQWFCLALFLRGAALFGKHEYDEAIKSYRQVLDDSYFDRPAYAWSNLGDALSAKGEHDEAIKAYHMALGDPNFDRPGNTWNNLGNALSAKGEHDEAIKAYHKALDDPNNDMPGKTWVNLGKTYLTINNREKAVNALEKALACSDLKGGAHATASNILKILSKDMQPKALSPDDRAMVEKAPSTSAEDDVEERIIEEIQKAGDTQYERYLDQSDSPRKDTLSILRGWSSAVTLLEGSERRWRGGGYFLKWRGYGIVIDPGFDFLRNFHDAGYHGREINAVVVSHNHPDHNSDLKGIDDLRYELFKRLPTTELSVSQPYVLIWDQDTSAATKFGIEEPQHHYEPIIMPAGFPQPIDLRVHQAQIPVRITPFKVSHGNDVPYAMGMVLELFNREGECVVRIGYTGDTAYFNDLSKYLVNCDLLIAHISQPSVEELHDASKLKEVHLGYRGAIQLINDCRPKKTLLAEFWAGFADLRIPLVKAVRQRSGENAVLPAGLGMHLKLPQLEIECTECRKATSFIETKVSPSEGNFGNLAYLCASCLIS